MSIRSPLLFLACVLGLAVASASQADSLSGWIDAGPVNHYQLGMLVQSYELFYLGGDNINVQSVSNSVFSDGTVTVTTVLEKEVFCSSANEPVCNQPKYIFMNLVCQLDQYAYDVAPEDSNGTVITDHGAPQPSGHLQGPYPIQPNTDAAVLAQRVCSGN